MSIVYISVGTNIGDRLLNLKRTEALFRASSEMKILGQSSVYETRPVDGPPQGNYLNAVWKIETLISPKELLGRFQLYEKMLGRKRHTVNGPRTIDLDILDFDGIEMSEQDLTLPHPRMAGRQFVLRPLFELEPGWRHPSLNKSVAALLLDLKGFSFSEESRKWADGQDGQDEQQSAETEVVYT